MDRLFPPPEHEVAPPLQIEGRTIRDPNNLDTWIVAILDTRDEAVRNTLITKGLAYDFKDSNYSHSRFRKFVADNYGYDLVKQLETDLAAPTASEVPVAPASAEPITNAQAEVIPSAMAPEPVVTLEQRPQKEKPLSDQKITELTNGALLRKRMIDALDDAHAIVSLTPADMGGIMGSGRRDALESIPKVEQQYQETFHEPYPAGPDLMISLSKLPKEVGQRFDAHGLAKGNQLGALVELLTNGINETKPFFTMPLVEDATYAALGASSPYTEGGFIVVGPPNPNPQEKRKLIQDHEAGTTNIKYVLVNKHYYFAIPTLEEKFPQVKFIKAEDMTKVLTEELA